MPSEDWVDLQIVHLGYLNVRFPISVAIFGESVNLVPSGLENLPMMLETVGILQQAGFKDLHILLSPLKFDAVPYFERLPR